MMKKEAHNKIDCFVSVVSVISNNEEIIEPFLKNMQEYLYNHFSYYEIILIDQQSKDGTVSKIDTLLKEIPHVRYIRLSFSVDDDTAWRAGVESAIGDFIVMFSPVYDPVECLTDIVKQCRNGSDIVVGVSGYSKTLRYCIFRPWFQWVLDSIGYDIPSNSTDLRCLSRRTVNAVIQTGRYHHQFFVRITKTGYPQSPYSYILKKNKNKTLREGIRQGFHLLVFNSTKPLRWISGLGLFASFLAFLISLYSLLIHFVKHNVVEGWTSMVIFMSVLFMFLFIILSFLGEYMIRLLDDQGGQQDYSVVFEKNSSVMLNNKQYNVLNESTAKDVNLVQSSRNK